MTSGIYMIEHIGTGRKYIGRSVDIEMRWHQHRSDAKKNRTNNPFHNSLRKHGREAFKWQILVKAPDRLHSILEKQFIEDWNTYWPNGFNLGGTEGGFPPRSVIDKMEPEEKARWEETLQRVARTGHGALKELRKDPEYEAEYLAMRSAACVKREANIKAKAAVDPEYAEKEKNRRTEAAKKNPKRNDAKASATFRERFESDEEYAERVRANRAKAGRISWEKRRAERRRINLETLEKLRASISRHEG